MVKSYEEKVDLALKMMAVIPDGWSVFDVATVAEMITARVIFDMGLEAYTEGKMIDVASDNIRLLIDEFHKITDKKQL